MTKITLTDLVNLQNETTAVNAVNSNNNIIKLAVDNTISRDGTSPNQMNASLDMNSHSIINLGPPLDLNGAARLQDLANITAGGLVQIPTATVLGNFSGSNSIPTAQPTTGTGSVVMSTLPTLTSPAIATPTITGVSVAPTASPGTNTTQLATTAFVTTAVAGNVSPVIPPQGRITLTTLTPVMTTSVAGATTVYYTPYGGNIVPIYNGSSMVQTVVAEVSQTTTDTTKSPAAVAASKIYDLFVWNDSGTIRCTRGPAWTNATTRGYTFTMQSGILLNTSSITNGPAASRGTYVGTIASNASSTIDYIFGSSGSGGVAAVLNVWNAYNRVDVSTSVVDSGTSYTYTTATARQARASTGNQVSFVIGSQEDAAFTTYSSKLTTTAVGAFPQTGIGLDVTNAFTNVPAIIFTYGGVTTYHTSSHTFNPAIGTHTVAAIEQGDGTNANSFDVSSIATLSLRLKM